MRSLDFSDPALSELGSRQKLVYAALCAYEPVTMDRLAEKLGTSKSNVHKALRELSREGLATNRPEPREGNRILWEATD